MRTVTVTEYVSSDGRSFKDKEACLAHEAEYDIVQPLIKMLGPKNPRGATYVQHDVETLKEVKRRAWAAITDKFGASWPDWKNTPAEDVHPTGIVGRVLDDYHGPLANLWATFCRFDFETGREYEQCFFAMNPHKAEEEWKPEE